MSTAQLIAVDLLVALLAAAAWLGAGLAAATRHARPALALAVAAVAVTLARVGTVGALATDGWWFVQEKVTLTLPLLGAAGLVAVAVAGPRLLRPANGRPSPAVVVPLMTAGYAGAAGLVFPLLVGYPASWPDALLTVAAVGAAALVTWRVSGGRPPRWSAAATVVVATAGLAGVGAGLATGAGPDTGGTPAAAGPGDRAGLVRPAGPGAARAGGEVAVTDLRGPAEPAPGGQVRRVTLTARKTTIRLSSGRSVPGWAYNGQVPGPPITAVKGDLIEVTLRNADIERGVTLHWHGYDVPAGEDGAPGLTQDAVPPGGEFVYRFRADQVGTFWYHTHQVSDEGVRKGLYGMLVVSDEPAQGFDLTVPVHTFQGRVALGTHDEPDARAVPPGTPVRLRLVNTDSTPHRFTLGGTAYRLVAVDGSDLNAPGELTEVGLRLAAGGRYDLAFTMPRGPVALLVDDDPAGGLRLAPGPAGGGAGPATTAPADTRSWPELDLTRYGAPTPTPFGLDSRFDRDFTLVLDRGIALVDGAPKYAFTVNGRGFPSVPDEVVRAGDLVRITVVNRSFDTHPWHLHGHRMLILTRNGEAVTGSPLWMDTFDVRPGEVWEVAFRADNPGLWMNHCHNLRHAAAGMALHLEYEGVSTPFHGSHGG
jgi:FtsP/CotA-like multicopper oxidase with cupredoxin domain